MDGKEKGLTLEDKIFLVKIEKFRESHLKILDQRVCRDCEKRECTNTCPVTTYTWEEDHIGVAYENCYECGTCRLACPYDNISWEYPPGGFGVEFRYG